jgi:hypothetical protein
MHDCAGLQAAPGQQKSSIWLQIVDQPQQINKSFNNTAADNPHTRLESSHCVAIHPKALRASLISIFRSLVASALNVHIVLLVVAARR